MPKLHTTDDPAPNKAEVHEAPPKWDASKNTHRPVTPPTDRQLPPKPSANRLNENIQGDW